jgi:hypothetical protein
MNYVKQATAKSPALVVYLLDTSSSMATPMNGFLKDGGTRIAVVRDAMDQVLRRMVSRSTKGLTISPRYHIAMAAYNHVVQPLTGKGPESVDQIASRGVPRLTSEGLTFTAQAFEWAEKLLIRELPGRADHPAPLICHMTDGEFNGDADPEPVVRRIKRLSNQDGSVLVLNIFIGKEMVRQPINDIRTWPGITSDDQLSSDYARKLFRLSSPIPEFYQAMIREEGYALDRKARMFFPGDHPDLVKLGFAMSGCTPTRR